eukprot:CAMPEP_0181178018 /NCGR_PEP_ID=MMETSP1096-20121128/5492_1 /TAXON_ID=156174 ORGANISM="Chrysochromulina ericina, Strain CCMP281" /NCGR_SAMPLE_ID=MMETSP1096 /ASSEMBLY_ACC=CAM_ASM_000453 /LENGTH=80 /DNA_ID=CAMNT_0023266251 /DNA_START=1027 /DNA_END=1269 /DNA_ORIENTATION=+
MVVGPTALPKHFLKVCCDEELALDLDLSVRWATCEEREHTNLAAAQLEKALLSETLEVGSILSCGTARLLITRLIAFREV